MAFRLSSMSPALALASARSFVQKMVAKASNAAHAVTDQAHKTAEAARHVVQDKVVPAAQKAVAKASAAKQAIQIRTVAQVKKTVAESKRIASATKKAADEKVWCPLKNAYVKGRDNAKAANAKPAEWSLKPPGSSSAPATDHGKSGYVGKDLRGPAQTAVTKGVGIGASVKVEKEANFLRYGDDDKFVKIGTAKASLATGYEYDPIEKSHTFSVIKAEAGIAGIEAQHKGTHAGGMLEHELAGEALSAKVSAEASVKKDAHGVVATVQAGAEATLIKGSAKGKVNITPKTIYDNTFGQAVNYFVPGSKYAKAVEWLDHGVVAGGEVEAGIGAAAKAEASLGKVDGVWGASAGATAGAGPMAGVKLFLGIK